MLSMLHQSIWFLVVLPLSFYALPGEAAGLDGHLIDRVESARAYIQNYPQCDYAHPDYCYELIRKGFCACSSPYNYNYQSNYGGANDNPSWDDGLTGSYIPYGGSYLESGSYSSYGCSCENTTYTSYSNYNPYSTYRRYPDASYAPNFYSNYNYLYSEAQLRIRFHLDDLESQDGFMGLHGNRVFYSPDLQRLFEPDSTIELSR